MTGSSTACARQRGGHEIVWQRHEGCGARPEDRGVDPAVGGRAARAARHRPPIWRKRPSGVAFGRRGDGGSWSSNRRARMRSGHDDQPVDDADIGGRPMPRRRRSAVDLGQRLRREEGRQARGAVRTRVASDRHSAARLSSVFRPPPPPPPPGSRARIRGAACAQAAGGRPRQVVRAAGGQGGPPAERGGLVEAVLRARHDLGPPRSEGGGAPAPRGARGGRGVGGPCGQGRQGAAGGARPGASGVQSPVCRRRPCRGISSRVSGAGANALQPRHGWSRTSCPPGRPPCCGSCPRHATISQLSARVMGDVRAGGCVPRPRGAFAASKGGPAPPPVASALLAQTKRPALGPRDNGRSARRPLPSGNRCRAG